MTPVELDSEMKPKKEEPSSSTPEMHPPQDAIRPTQFE